MKFEGAFTTYKHKKAVKHDRGLLLAIEVCSLCDVKIRSKDKSIVIDVGMVNVLFPKANFDNLETVREAIPNDGTAKKGQIYSVRFDARFLRRELMRAYELTDNTEIATTLSQRFANAVL